MNLLEKTAEEYLRMPDLAIRLVELAPIALVVVGPRGLIRIVNQRAELLSGYDRRELIGETVELLVPDTLKEIHAAQHRPGFFADPQPRPMAIGLALQMRRKDGTEVPVRIELQPIPDPEGPLVMVAIQRSRGA